MEQAIRMVKALSIPRDFRADDAVGITVVLGSVHAPNAAVAKQFNIERAG
jgi:hypothetical protein